MVSNNLLPQSKTATLTARQKEIYDFLKDKIINRGYGPTVREIGSHFGIRSPNGVMCHLKALEKKGLITRESHMSRAIQLSEQPQRQTSLPLAGQIAAGAPVLAEEQTERIDFGSMFNGDDSFCLRVKGESMIDDNIASGDYVVVKRQQTCRDGEIVVALVDDQEATLKRFYREPDRIRLEPANSSMEPIYSNNVEILGVVTGVVRKYM
jgi:repressor LexA